MKNSFHLNLSGLTITSFFLISLLITTGCATSRLGKKGQSKLRDKTIVIIGASSGFGRGLAERLGSYHANVVLAARRTELLEEVAINVRKGGGKALVVTTDISKVDDIKKLAASALKEFGHIDVWINDVGVGAIGRFWEIPLEDHARLLDVNLKGIIYGSHQAIQIFRDQGYGKLINLGSIDSEIPMAYQILCCFKGRGEKFRPGDQPGA